MSAGLRRQTATLAAALLLATGLARAQGVPPPVAQALKAAGIPDGAVGLEVRAVEGNGRLAAANTEAGFNPASTMKILTAAAALDRFGPAHTWKTGLYTNGEVKGGILFGDLYVKGGGDPHFVLEDLWTLVRKLRLSGLKTIRGNAVLDRTLFRITDCDPPRFDGEPFKPQNVCPDPLLLNFNAVRLDFSSQGRGKPVSVRADPRPLGLTIVNQLKVVNGECPDFIRPLIELDPPGWAHAAPGRPLPGKRLTVGGRYPASCTEKSLFVAVLPAPVYFQQVFEQLWKESGGIWGAQWQEGAAPPNATLLAEYESGSLAEVVRDMNKQSNNAMARQLLALMGGPDAIAQWAAARRIALPQLVVENGSGLSRSERITPAGLANALVAAYHSPTMPELMSSFPVVGADGTMRRRMGESTVAGRAHIKTGSLNNVRSIAGYVLAESGKRYAVVMIVNHERAAGSKPAFDALLQWVAGVG
jgi:D-alanyl-D-alanine carboxypeptidase/D-alanyl-D-alanine-endopeptidase (penicillin-binding protein 4)